jgi:hypothetical protein
LLKRGVAVKREYISIIRYFNATNSNIDRPGQHFLFHLPSLSIFFLSIQQLRQEGTKDMGGFLDRYHEEKSPQKNGNK